jgi:hypothetical protein
VIDNFLKAKIMSKSYLLVLDLNGTLLERVTKKKMKAFKSAYAIPPTPDFSISSGKVFKRPFVDEFIDGIFKNFDVAVWTSALEKNAVPMVQNLFQAHTHQLKFLWNRSDCSDVKEGVDHSSVKDLRKIWEAYPDYDSVILHSKTDF